MRDRNRSLDFEGSEDEVLEIELVDFTNEDEYASGPVDIYQTSTSYPRVPLSAAQTQPRSPLAELEIRRYSLRDKTTVRSGDFVELQCPPHRRATPECSGDYLRIKRILQDCCTGEVILEGHKFVREKYLVGKVYNVRHPDLEEHNIRRENDRSGARLNELVMHLTTRTDDDRPAEVQGLQRIPTSSVKCKEDVIVTDKPYPMQGFRYLPTSTIAHLNGKSTQENRQWLFNNGPIVSRWSRTSIVSPNGKIYGGVWRHFLKKDLGPPRSQQPASYPRPASNTRASGPVQRRRRNTSVEEVDPLAVKRTLPSTRQRYTFLDMYCGNGGASRGAQQAGLKVVAGLDHNEIAMEGWQKNNPGAIPLCMDSFNYIKYGVAKMFGGRCDIINISNPCQCFSCANTRGGKNNQNNLAQLHAVKHMIEVAKARVVVIENTSGLANMERNRSYFNRLLFDIFSAGSGYNLRYQIVNMADYGLPQERKRLIIIAARKDLPLPPFPKPTHGPSGSGLKAYVSIGDTLKNTDTFGERAETDPYQRPHRKISAQDWSYDPFTKFVDCIVTGGVTCPHWNGEKFTPRDLAWLQSLPPDHHLTGSWPQAIKQIGNMFPPLMAELIYLSCAQTLEAFDHGFISADDDLDDLNVILIEKGFEIPGSSLTPASVFDLTGSVPRSPYRYLSQPVLSDARHVDHSSAWEPRTFDQNDHTDRTRKRSFNSSSDDETTDNAPSPIEQRFKRAMTSAKERQFWEGFNGEIIEVSDSEE